MKGLTAKKPFLYAFLCSIGVSALIGIGILIFGNFGELEIRVLLTALTITVTSILGLACGALLETGKARVIPIAGIGLSLLSSAMWMFVIWPDGNRGDLFIRILLSATILAAACSHLSLLSLARFENRFGWVHVAAYATISPLMAILVFLVWDSHFIGEEITGRVVGVLSILVAVVTVMTPIFHWLSRTEPTAAEIDSEIETLKNRIATLERQRSELIAAVE